MCKGASFRAALPTSGGTWLSVTRRSISGSVQLTQRLFGHVVSTLDQRLDFFGVSLGVIHRCAHLGLRPLVQLCRLANIPSVLARQVAYQPHGGSGALHVSHAAQRRVAKLDMAEATHASDLLRVFSQQIAGRP